MYIDSFECIRQWFVRHEGVLEKNDVVTDILGSGLASKFDLEYTVQ